ncbi:hypothetical protein HUT16_07800 [Kitasatospora sp. NA04385]|uniref:hypothetical protein n=1 Tax=Kitasatospora sp. NA04385 TaxID=2742135 RepID=UPI0015907263|nr:hypothetical protein [Kitasatospora sp. NA04385]QKW18979.1 hypothetical protein HUT16_07800 [Kitasatospora sp. NA04385]
MNQIPLLCPRCGRPQRIVHGEGPHRPVRVVHTETGRESCEEPAEPDGGAAGEAPADV